MKEFLLNLFFPKKCVNCLKLENYICESCLSKITFIKTPTCFGCGKITKNGKFCKTCKRKSDLTGVISAAYFENGPLKELVHSYKYEGLKDADKILASLMAGALGEYSGLSNENTILTYVPIHKNKLKDRGYNQTELLAKELAKLLKLEFLPLLTKTKKTKSQMGLKRRERQQNLEGAFSINIKNTDKIKGKEILIMDDIVTTGSTLAECAKVLNVYSPKEIWGITVGKD